MNEPTTVQRRGITQDDIPAEKPISVDEDWFCKEVTKRTNGRLAIEFISGRTLQFKDSDILGIVQKHVLEAGHINDPVTRKGMLERLISKFPNL